MLRILLLPVIALLLFISCKKNGNGPSIQSITISSMRPDSGAFGDYVSIVGHRLTQPDSVTLNGKPCPIKNFNGDSIVISVPKAAGSGPVKVYINDTVYTWPLFHFRYTSYVKTLAYCKDIHNANTAGPEVGYIWPYSIAADTNGNVYIAGYSTTPYIRKIDSLGVFTAYAGDGNIGSRLGPAGQAEFGTELYKMARDRQGNLAVYGWREYKIYKIEANGTVGLYVGARSTGYDVGLGLAGMTFNDKGELFYTDDTYIKRVHLDGSITNYIGDGFSYVYGVNKPPAEADTTTGLFGGGGMCFDNKGNLIFADGPYIRMCTPQGRVKVLAGGSDNSYYVKDGPAAQATFYLPTGMAVDKDGNIYISEFSDRIRKLGTD
ncbi:MAG TPA: SBBP repeat-containing protein, partial [Puia sp.]